MTRPLVTKGLASRMTAQVRALAYQDAAIYHAPHDSNFGLDEFGHPSSERPDVEIACSFVDAFGFSSVEKWESSGDISQAISSIRFHDVIPSNGGSFTLTKKFGTPVKERRTFEIVGIQDRGGFGYVCALKLAEK